MKMLVSQEVANTAEHMARQKQVSKLVVVWSDKGMKWSENVWCLTVISHSEFCDICVFGSQADNLIAVLDAQGAEITTDTGDEVIVYAKNLAPSELKYFFCDEEGDDISVGDKESCLLLENSVMVIRVDGLDEIFATGIEISEWL